MTGATQGRGEERHRAAIAFGALGFALIARFAETIVQALHTR